MFELEYIFSDITSTDEAVHFHLHVVSESETHLLGLLCQFTRWRQDEYLRLSERNIDCLQSTKGEDARLTSTTLTLYDHVSFLYDRQNRSLLDGRRLVEAISIQP